MKSQRIVRYANFWITQSRRVLVTEKKDLFNFARLLLRFSSCLVEFTPTRLIIYHQRIHSLLFEQIFLFFFSLLSVYPSFFLSLFLFLHLEPILQLKSSFLYEFMYIYIYLLYPINFISSNNSLLRTIRMIIRFEIVGYRIK